ncbi:MAG: hypothetical protein LBD11_01555 [Candidatus Peribacteria bacterium]|jgi:hypothetical protein|nr:hypothetical protein [Candidatus Peribacteria bacterium]
MAINKDLLYRDVVIALEYHQTDIEQQGIDLQFILFLIHKVIYNDCIHNSVFKGRKKDYV